MPVTDQPTPTWQTRPVFDLKRLNAPMKKGGLQAEIDYAEHNRRHPPAWQLKRKYRIN